MVTKDEAFQQRLLTTFRNEASERLDVLSSGLITLEQAEADDRRAETFESLVREAHSLKGAARAVNLPAIESLARALEQALSSLKQENAMATQSQFDTFHQAVDGIKAYLASASPAESEAASLRQLTHAIENASSLPPQTTPSSAPPQTPSHEEHEPEPEPAKSIEHPTLTDTVRISTSRLSALLLEVEQLTAAKLTAQQHVTEVKTIQKDLSEWLKAQRKEETSAPQQQGVRDYTQKHLRQLITKTEGLDKSAEQNYRFLETALASLQEDIKNVLMLPVSTALVMFPKMVRDLSRTQGKEVEWVVHGEDIEIDKRIMDEVTTPLIHLVRNCIDHGIEKPELREASGKERRGKITLGMEQTAADKFEITLEDDGAGMDPGGIRAAAIKNGLIPAEKAESLDEEETLSLAFRSGVTTSPIVTDISGRGLGLAIVQEQVTKLNGTLDFNSRPGSGTLIHMTLPLTLATFRGIVVRCGDDQFIVPSANVAQVLRIDQDALKAAENRPVLRNRDTVMSMVMLSEVLELPGKQPSPSGTLQAFIARAGGKEMAFAVDAIHSEQEVLVKPLGKQLARVRNISGAAVVASGRIVPILNVSDLIASAVKTGVGITAPDEKEVSEVSLQSLLIVEDSITTRTLLKNILETAGYEVQTAVNGLDALSKLRENDFDLVVSDVAMPSMNGFDLTERIRHDKHLSETPVVLLTSLESQQDREKGIDVGANAYLVKSSFDQSNLLEIIKRLI